MRVDGIDPRVGVGHVGDAEVKAAFPQFVQLPASVLLQRYQRPAIAASTRVQRTQPRDRVHPGQRFTTGTTNPRGHRDFNFEQDPEAFRVLLGSRVPLTLAPFEISSKVWLKAPDLEAIARGSAKSEWIVAPARRWLALWDRTFGVDGFNPFDTLAIARITSPSQLTCEALPARIDVLDDDVTEARVQGTTVARKPYLLVSREFGGPAPMVDYCYDVAASFKPDLIRRITGRR